MNYHRKKMGILVREMSGGVEVRAYLKRRMVYTHVNASGTVQRAYMKFMNKTMDVYPCCAWPFSPTPGYGWCLNIDIDALADEEAARQEAAVLREKYVPPVHHIKEAWKSRDVHLIRADDIEEVKSRLRGQAYAIARSNRKEYELSVQIYLTNDPCIWVWSYTRLPSNIIRALSLQEPIPYRFSAQPPGKRYVRPQSF